MTDGTGDDATLAAARDVSHAYGDLSVLEEVTLDAPGEAVTAVVGPNGSGKSTLLRILAGVLEPDAGTVRLSTPDGPPVETAAAAGSDPTAGRLVGWLPQRLAPRESFTVAETVRHYAGLAGADPAPDRVLDRVGMTGVADRRVAALSGGMARLLGVALATVGDPPLLVLDEPTSGLDPAMTVRIYDALAALAASGRAVVLSSHDLAAVERTADAVVLLDHGAVQFHGPPAALAAETGASDAATGGASLLSAFHDEYESAATTVRDHATPRP